MKLRKQKPDGKKRRTCRNGHAVVGKNVYRKMSGKGQWYDVCRACHNHQSMLHMRKYRQTSQYRIRMGYAAPEVREVRVLRCALQMIEEAAKKVNVPPQFIKAVSEFVAAGMFHSNQVRR